MGSVGRVHVWRFLRSFGRISLSFLLAALLVSAERGLKNDVSRASNVSEPVHLGAVSKALNFLWQPDESGYKHSWPVK